MGYTLEEPRKKEYTFYLAAKDRSGNYSEPASITVQHPGIRKIHLPQANVKEFFQAVEIKLPPVFKKTDIHGEVIDEEKEVLGYVLRMERIDENVAGDSETFIEEKIPLTETEGRKVVEIPAGSSWEVQLGAYDSVVNKRFNPKEFEETFSDPVEASGAQISKIRDFVKGLQPVMLVEELPDLPHAEYPEDSYCFRIPDSEDDEDYGHLYRNENGEWVEKNDPDLEEGMAAYPRVVAGTLQAGAISAHHIRSINADISEIVAGNDTIIINEQGIQHVDDYFVLNEDGAVFSGSIEGANINISDGDFTVDEDGVMHAEEGTFNGDLTSKGTVNYENLDLNYAAVNEVIPEIAQPSPSADAELVHTAQSRDDWNEFRFLPGYWDEDDGKYGSEIFRMSLKYNTLNNLVGMYQLQLCFMPDHNDEWKNIGMVSWGCWAQDKGYPYNETLTIDDEEYKCSIFIGHAYLREDRVQFCRLPAEGADNNFDEWVHARFRMLAVN